MLFTMLGALIEAISDGLATSDALSLTRVALIIPTGSPRKLKFFCCSRNILPKTFELTYYPESFRPYLSLRTIT